MKNFFVLYYWIIRIFLVAVFQDYFCTRPRSVGEIEANIFYAQSFLLHVVQKIKISAQKIGNAKREESVLRKHKNIADVLPVLGGTSATD